MPSRPTRRSFLSASAGLSAAAVGSGAVAGAFGAFLNRAAAAPRRGPGTETKPGRGVGFGPPVPVADETTGLPLLSLPEGFRYKSFGWTGEPMADGRPTPGQHDGMGVVSEATDAAGNRVLTLVRNHERDGEDDGYEAVSADTAFDPKAPGACSTLRFDATEGEWLDAKLSLSGTVKNCAGGTTGRGGWFSCEETVSGPGETDEDGVTPPYTKPHGWVFEVDPAGVSSPTPLEAMGRFKHEAVAVDPADGTVYETEDQKKGGLYRFRPADPADMTAGGILEMLKVPGEKSLRGGQRVGKRWDAEWVTIDDPTRGHSPEGLKKGEWDEHGVYQQGKDQGATTFARMEGAWFGPGPEGVPGLWAVSTSGGAAGLGQVWFLDPVRQTLTLIYETPGADVLDSPDNITVSPRGGVVLCEDGDVKPQRLHGLTPGGVLFPLAENNVVSVETFPGDHTAEEWAGATFDSRGEWLFANIQTPGVTFAITGPWADGGL